MSSANAIRYTIGEARSIGDMLGVDWEIVDIQQFLKGLNVEREHGLVHQATNITNDNDLVTGKIALAHLNELPDYYTRLEQMESGQKPDKPVVYHYYGDTVRKLFFIAAGIMLVSLPFVKEVFSVPVFLSLVGIIVLDLLAGLTNPLQKWVSAINAVIAGVAVVLTELFAINSMSAGNEVIFVINQFLALLFLMALYYDTKTLRSMLQA